MTKGGWHHTEEAKKKIAEVGRTGGFKGHKHTQESKEKMRQASRGNTSARKKVKCLETSEIFDSLSSAAQSRGLRGANSITQAIKKGGTAGKVHWEYYN